MNFFTYGLKGFRNLFSNGSTNAYSSPPNPSMNSIFQPGEAVLEDIVGNEGTLFDTTGVLQIVLNKKAAMKSVGVWKNYKVNPKDGSKEDLGPTPIIERLNNPNPLQSGMEFLKQLSINRDVYGFNPVYALTSGLSIEKAPAALWNILPSEMTIEASGLIYEQTDINKIISQFVYNKNGKSQKIYQADEILYMVLNNVKNPIMPTSPFNSLNMEISNIRAAMAYRNVLLRKKGAIGILSNQSKGENGAIPLENAEKKRIESQYQKDYGLSDEQMKIIITNASLLWQPMNYMTKDLMLFEEIDSNMKKIIDWYGLNELLFSTEESKTMSDSGTKLAEVQKMVYQDTIIPESKDDAKAFSDYLGETKEGRILELDYSHIHSLKDNEEKKAAVLTAKIDAFLKLIEAGVARNKALEIAGLDESDLK